MTTVRVVSEVNDAVEPYSIRNNNSNMDSK